MKYQSICLNDVGNQYSNYSIVKCDEQWKKQLSDLKKWNKELAYSVEQCFLFNAQERYMLIRGKEKCIGIMAIQTPFDKSNVEVEMKFHQDRLYSSEEMSTVLEQLVESFKLYFFDKKQIVIKLEDNEFLAQEKNFKMTRK